MTNKKETLVFNSFSYGWYMITHHFLKNRSIFGSLCIAIIIASLILFGGVYGLINILGQNYVIFPLLIVVMGFVGLYFFSWLFLRFNKIILAMYDEKQVSPKDFFVKDMQTTQNFLANIFSGILIFGGLVLLIIPGIYIAVRVQFASLLIADKGYSWYKAVQESRKMTNGVFWDLILQYLIYFGLRYISMFTLYVLLLRVYPAYTHSTVYIYRKLLERQL